MPTPTRIAIALTILAALILSGLSTTLLAQPPAPDAPHNLPAQLYLPSLARPFPTAVPTAVPTAAPTPAPFQPGLNTVAGHVQKGPFIQGTALTLSELSAALIPTGRSFPSDINSNTGSFTVRGVLTSPFVELSATGFYFNEVTNSLSSAPINLHALADLGATTGVNINLLTHLERARVYVLVDQGLAFAAAKAQAQAEVLAAFGYTDAIIGSSETLDISQDGAGNAILLAISAILQANRSEAQLTQLLAQISADLAPDGVLDSQNLHRAIYAGMEAVKPIRANIRANIAAHYAELGLPATVPPFKNYAFILDTTPPAVAASSPADGADQEVSDITLTFNDLLQHATLNAATLVLRDAAGAPLNGLDLEALLVAPANLRQDVRVKLGEKGDGRYAGEAAFVLGRRDLVLSAKRAGQEVFHSRNRIDMR